MRNDSASPAGLHRASVRHVGCSLGASMRTSSRARVVLLLAVVWALAAATASAQETSSTSARAASSRPWPRRPGRPPPTLTTRIEPARCAARHVRVRPAARATSWSARCAASCTSAPAVPAWTAARASPRRSSRVTGGAKDVVANGALDTSIRGRRNVVDPIVVPMPLDDVARGVDRRAARPSTSACRTSAAASAASRSSTTPSAARARSSSTRRAPRRRRRSPPRRPRPAPRPPRRRCRRRASRPRPDSPRFAAGSRRWTRSFASRRRRRSAASVSSARLSRRVARALTFVRAAELIEATPATHAEGAAAGRRASRRSSGADAATVASRPQVGDPLAALAQGAKPGSAADRASHDVRSRASSTALRARVDVRARGRSVVLHLDFDDDARPHPESARPAERQRPRGRADGVEGRDRDVRSVHSDRSPPASPLPSGTVGFALFLGTGAAGMPSCADVAVTLTKCRRPARPSPWARRRSPPSRSCRRARSRAGDGVIAVLPGAGGSRRAIACRSRSR